MVSLIALSNIMLQIVILAIIIVGLFLKKKHKLFQHGSTMLVAVILNLLSFLLAMGPSLLNLEPVLVVQPTNSLSIATFVHAFFGTVAEVLGIYVIVSWRLEKSASRCAAKKKIMRAVTGQWLVALVSGFVVFILLYL